MAESRVSISVDFSAFEVVSKRLQDLVTFDAAPLLEEIAAMGESQTRRRITDEKTAPDGTPWPANRAGTSILLDTGRNLLASVAFTSSDTEAVWGASWEFAHIHQNGAVIEPKTAKALYLGERDGKKVFAKRVTIPARPFIGLSDANRAEIDDLITDHFARLGPGGPR